MRRILIVLAASACLALPAVAGEEKPRLRARWRLWRAPAYLVIGLPRDLLDAPSKLLSSIPVFNRVFLAPLGILNGLTTLASWSFTSDGLEAGFEAWVACINMRRSSKRAPPPASIQDRPWWKNYFPNWRTFRVVTLEPEEE